MTSFCSLAGLFGVGAAAFAACWLMMGTAGAAEKPELLRSETFPILAWDFLHSGDEPKNGVASMVECGYTVVGFVSPGHLEECERLGVKAFVIPPKGVAGFEGDFFAWSRQWKHLDEETIDRRIREIVEAAGDSPAIAGYYIMDEPGATSFPALAQAVSAVRKYAPGKLAYINLLPGYATIGAPDDSQLQTPSFEIYLERYVEIVKPDFLSYDDYMVQYGMDLQAPDATARYYTDLAQVRGAARRHGLPFWNIVSSNQIRPYTTIPSPANLQFQAYTTLAAGGRGLTWYTYYDRGYGYAPINAQGNRTTTWSYLRMVNHQIRTIGDLLLPLEHTGLYASPPPIDRIPPLPGRVLTSVECELPVMAGEFKDEQGRDYVLLVNLSLERSVKATPMRDGEPVQGVYFSAVDGSEQPIDYEHGLWMTAGQGVLLRVDGT